MDPKELLDNLSTHLKNAVARAISLATSMGHQEVGVLHLLYGLLEEEGAIASEILKKSGIDKNYLIAKAGEKYTGVKKNTKIPVMVTTIPELDPVSKKALERAMLLAYKREHTYIGTEHLLHSLLDSESPDISSMCQDLKIDLDDLTEDTSTILESTSRFPNIEEVQDALDEMGVPTQPDSSERMEQASVTTEQTKKKGKGGRPSALSLFSVELTSSERQKKIDPVIGREQEIERLMHILSRRNKNNPVLVGEPGVGKTAIVEGLAKKIMEGTVPASLKRKKIFSLDLTLLISGTMYRGEFESRLKQVIDECSANPNVILFIDEIHNIIGAGSNQGTMDAANILKPALARGDLRCVGATTFDEYKKYIANDPALDRRFQEITVDEPSVQQTIDILSGLKKYYEEYHGVTITKEAIESAVELSTKYVHDNFLPDKAIDLIDEAGAAVQLHQKPTATANKLSTLEDTKEQLLRKKEQAIANEAFDTAMQFKEELQKVNQKIEQLKKSKTKPRTARSVVDQADIAAVLSRKLHIQTDLLLKSDVEQLQTLEQRLEKHIIGQSRVIKKIVQTLRQAHLGIDRKKRPLASFLFTGPSGVGKTKLAEALAQELYFDEKALVRIDMSEFAEAHGVSKLLGSPAGYIGHKERNKFFDALSARPYSVVLFDEFDKAHEDVRKLLYQILDEGTLTDSTGKKINFTHTIVVLTSNIGADVFDRGQFGFGNATQTKTGHTAQEILAKEKVKEFFGAAFLGRLGSVCVFNPLTREDTVRIIEQHIHQMNTGLSQSLGIRLTADTKALTALAELSHDKDLGVRNLEHTVNDIVQSLIVETKMRMTKKGKKTFRLTKTADTYTLM